MYSPDELRAIESADDKRNWPEIPPTAPPEIRARIVDRRAKALGIAQKDPATEGLRDRAEILKSLSL